MKKKQSFRIEYLVYFYILLIPIFDFLFNHYINNSSFDFLFQFNLIKLIIPLMLYIYVLYKAKGKERIQFFILTFIYIIYSSVILFIFHNKLFNNQISKEDFIGNLLNIYNLTIFVLNFVILYKLFFRKQSTKLRMSYNYSAAIYLISILLLSLTSQSELIWHNNLLLIILMLLFIALVSLRYREDRTFSFILFISLSGYLITTIKSRTSYYGILIIALMYIISLIVEKYVKKQLTLSELYRLIKQKVYSFVQKIRDIDKNKIRRLKSGDKIYYCRTITGYSDKRIYRYNDLNRKKRFKTKESIKKYLYDLEIKRILTKEDGSGIKEVKTRLKKKKKEKKQAKIDTFLNSSFTRFLFSTILVVISILIMYLIYNFIRNNIELNFSIKEQAIYFIYFIPIIYVIFKLIYFIILKFKNIDSEFIMLSLLVISIAFLMILNNNIILDFSGAMIFSTILVILINKVHIGETDRDIEILKEQIEYKKNLVSKKRVCFGITSLTIGGVSRILVDVCNSLSKKYSDIDVEIFTLFAGGEFEEDLNIKVKSLFKKPFNSYKPTIKFFILAYLKLFEPNIFNKYIRGNYDDIIAFDEGAITSLFSYNDDAKKIAWVHNKDYNIYAKSDKNYIRHLCNLYSRYDKIIFAREISLRRFNKVFISKKVRRIPKDIITNYVDPLRIFVKSEAESVYEWTEDTVALLSVVRLYKHKALDRFIRVHKRVLNDGLDHKIYIIGDGPEMKNLKKLIREEKLQTSVFLLGTKINPYPYIKNSSYFCLFSEKEEYSIVLNEAKILNKDILITDTKTRDIVQDYPNVRIFDNSESGIYTGLRYVLSNPKKDKTNFEYIYKNDEILTEIYSLLY